ncbi:MAG: hypothetical protein HC804_14930 [Anaerolineae bacterium]|nr:hypothetical protein [Anaerolineae bacterium]
MMAATWLMSRVRGLLPELGRLLFSAAAAEVIAQAGPTAVTWLEARAMSYETEGQRVNLRQLRHDLNAHFTESELCDLCATMGATYETLYGRDKCEKVWELVTWALRYGRVLELAARCLELHPFTGAN